MLFRGNSILVRGSSADEEQAKKARTTLTGDLLWFQLDGKAFITQDKDVMDRIEALGPGTPLIVGNIAQSQRQMDQLNAQEHALQARIEEVNRNLRNSQRDGLNAQPQTDLEEIRRQVANLRVVSAQMEALAARREAELRAMESQLELARRNAEQGAVRNVEILRRAVQEGKAQIVP